MRSHGAGMRAGNALALTPFTSPSCPSLEPAFSPRAHPSRPPVHPLYAQPGWAYALVAGLQPSTEWSRRQEEALAVLAEAHVPLGPAALADIWRLGPKPFSSYVSRQGKGLRLAALRRDACCSVLWSVRGGAL